jgi:nucleoside-diphosphate-sugar epimerase
MAFHRVPPEVSALKTIFLTGATGYIGGTVALSLRRSGLHVRGLVRSQTNAERLSAIGIEPVIGDLDDDELLIREARAADGVINAASADHVSCVKAMLSALAGTSKPFLHTSGSSIVGDDARGSRSSEVIFDEDTPLVVQPLKQARRAIDLMVLAAAAQGVRSVVICPSLIYGQGWGLSPDSVQIPFLAANAVKQGRVQIVGAGLNVWSNVHVDDVAALFFLSLAGAPAGAFYFAANGEASFAQIGRALSARLGLPEVEFLVPEVAAERWGIARAYFSFGSNSRVRSVRARQELGWAPEHVSVIEWILREMPIGSSLPNFE